MIANHSFAQLPLPADSVYQIIKANSIYRNNVNWNLIDKEFKNQLDTSKTLQDTMKCFVHVFEKLNDPHSAIYFNNVYYGYYRTYSDSVVKLLRPLLNIETELKQIFSNHEVSSYVSIVRGIRTLFSSVYLLRAVAGMVAPGGKEINSKVNAIQTLIVCKQDDEFKITLFQNTPAAFHCREELSSKLTKELQQAWNRQL